MRGAFFAAVAFSAFLAFADTIDLHSGGGAVCKVDVEHGARIVSWKVQGEEMLWNPGENWAKNGAALYGELPDDAWRHILSIEPSTFGMKDAKPLLPGESRVLTAVISKDDSL